MVNLETLKEEILADGIIDSAEVESIKKVLYEDGIIDTEEAKLLFELNDAVSGKENSPEWQDFFVSALTDYVLADEKTPNVLDAEESTFLIEAIKGDGIVDESELKLLVNILSKAESCTDDFVNFVMDSVKAAIIADGIVDADEVQMLKTVIYGIGGFGGSEVDRSEANLLFDINDATTSNEGHHSSWPELFVTAISSHVLDDVESPNEIDEDEGDWLLARIEGDGEYDSNEKALLSNIKEKAAKITGKLSFKIEMFS
jgi:hypothetical protein